MTVCCSQACRTSDQLELKVDDADSCLPYLIHQKTVHVWINYYKTYYLLQVGTFEGISLLWPPLPGKAIKLSFSTSPKSLSPRFNLALVYREAELSASEINLIAALFLSLINISKSQEDLFQCYLTDEVVY